MNEHLTIGDYVCDAEDKNNSDPAIIVYDSIVDGYPKTLMIKRADGHVSTRQRDELKEIPPLDFMKVWCKNQIAYKNG